MIFYKGDLGPHWYLTPSILWGCFRVLKVQELSNGIDIAEKSGRMCGDMSAESIQDLLCRVRVDNTGSVYFFSCHNNHLPLFFWLPAIG